MSESGWDETCDVLVVGSGGGLTGAYFAAAAGLKTIVLESTDKFGGTTAYSGGGMWIPDSPATRRANVVGNTVEDARTYFHAVIGDRAYAAVPEAVAVLGRAAAEGLLAEGVMPVIKHIPGHGRGTVDSHEALPRVDASRATLERTDFLPFRLLADLPWAMTGHLLFDAVDPDDAITVSARGIAEVIRGHIGFEGLLLSDDLSMQALGGELGNRAERALAAGCDIALHCNGRMEEMKAVAAHTGPMTEAAGRRFAQGRAFLARHHAPLGAPGLAEARRQLTSLLPRWG